MKSNPPDDAGPSQLLSERLARFDPTAEYVREVFLDQWRGGPILRVLGDPPHDLDTWVASRSETHYLLGPSDGRPGFAIRRREYAEFYVLCMDSCRAVLPACGTAREQALKISPKELQARASDLIGRPMWAAAPEKGPSLFHEFFVRAADDPELAARFDKLFRRYLKISGSDEFFFEVVDGLCVNFTTARMLEYLKRFIDEGLQHSPAVQLVKRFQTAVHTILAEGSPFSGRVRGPLRVEWAPICQRAHDRYLEMAYQEGKMQLEQEFDGLFVGSRPKGEKQARQYFARETVYLMKFLKAKRMSDYGASRLAAETLHLVCGAWYQDPDPENVLKRYQYHARKAARSKGNTPPA